MSRCIDTRDDSLGRAMLLEAGYNVGEWIGNGSWANVYRVSKGETAFAAKITSTKLISDTKMRTYIEGEVAIHRELSKPEMRHPNIVMLEDVLRREEVIVLVLELCDTSLKKFIESRRRQPIEEAVVRDFARQLSNAVAFLGRHGIVHRDISPGNVFMKFPKRPGEESAVAGGGGAESVVLKLGDFGFAKQPKDELCDSVQVGTPLYKAPEISVTGGSLYGLGVDIWSLGAILFECLAGKYMMQVRTLDEANAWKANFSRLSFPADIPLSPQCCDFVSRLVRKVGDGRLSHSQLLSHPWLLPALCLFAISNPTSPDEPPLITCDNKELCVMNESCGALTWKAFLHNLEQEMDIQLKDVILPDRALLNLESLVDAGSLERINLVCFVQPPAEAPPSDAPFWDASDRELAVLGKKITPQTTMAETLDLHRSMYKCLLASFATLVSKSLKSLKATESLLQIIPVLQENTKKVIADLQDVIPTRAAKWAENYNEWMRLIARLDDATKRLSAVPELAMLVCDKGDIAAFIKAESFPAGVSLNIPKDESLSAQPAAEPQSQELAMPTTRLVGFQTQMQDALKLSDPKARLDKVAQILTGLKALRHELIETYCNVSASCTACWQQTIALHAKRSRFAELLAEMPANCDRVTKNQLEYIRRANVIIGAADLGQRLTAPPAAVAAPAVSETSVAKIAELEESQVKSEARIKQLEEALEKSESHSSGLVMRIKELEEQVQKSNQMEQIKGEQLKETLSRVDSLEEQVHELQIQETIAHRLSQELQRDNSQLRQHIMEVSTTEKIALKQHTKEK